MQLSKQAFSVIISAPSGTGKSTLINMILQSHSNFALSVSATTRPKRPDEEEGINYFFKTKADFIDLIKQNAFVEYADVFGNYYGTLKSHIQQQNDIGKNIILDVDPVGAKNIINQLGNKVISIYILPPSLQHLKQRLQTRNTESAEVIDIRLSKAKEQLQYWKMYDYVIVNNNLNVAFLDLQNILLAHMHSNKNILDIKY